MSTRFSFFAIPTSHFLAKIIIILVSLCSTYHILVLATHDIELTPPHGREALGIVIGGGQPISIGGSPAPQSPSNCAPPPPPPPCPPPQAPPVASPTRVQLATQVINKFLGTVDGNNPCNLRPSNNLDICINSKFGCAPLGNQQALYSIQFNECLIKGKNNQTLTLDNFINKLPEVSIFHANSNNFGGKIPVLSQLPYLFELDLSNNKYEGYFPRNVLGAVNLTYLDLRFNNFVGPIPPELFNLQVLALFINNNKFDQELPSNLGSLTAPFITFANNRFTGPIPKSIGQASESLLEILFLNNTLSGCLPYEIGLLKKARVFDVSHNILTGPIPRSFACLGKMEYLVLAQNELYGPVPEEVCKLPYLKQLDLCDNYFTQVGPACMELMRKGVLDVKGNCVLGLPNQRSPETCTGFFNKPKFCAEGNMVKYIPCKSTAPAPYLNYEIVLEGVPQPQPSVTYGALSP